MFIYVKFGGSMSKFLKISYLLFFFVFILTTCSDDDSSTNTNPTNQTYFPTSVGSFWKYLEYDIDSLGIKVPETEDTVLTTIIGNQVINGKNATIFLNRYSKEASTDTSFLAYENEKVYTFLSAFDNDFIPIGESNQWIVISDFNANQWTILKDTTLQQVDLPGIGKMTPTVGATGRKGSKGEMVVKGKTVQSQEFIITFKLNIKLEIPNVPMPVNLKFDVVQHIWYGLGIGVIQRRLDPFKFNVLLFEQSFNGNESKIIDYNIK